MTFPIVFAPFAFPWRILGYLAIALVFALCLMAGVIAAGSIPRQKD